MDFRAHLRGRIAHVALLNPQRGERLKQMPATLTVAVVVGLASGPLATMMLSISREKTPAWNWANVEPDD